MRAAERGFLLLSSHLGDAQSKPLTAAQLRNLALRMQTMGKNTEDRDLSISDMKDIGYSADMAEHILSLLSEENRLREYLKRAQLCGCVPVTRVSEGYPLLLRKRLGLDSPGCLWVKGDVSLLKQPAVALVGSRDLKEENRAFAREVGKQAALQGYVLISGNARGADRCAQDRCLAAGGQVISVVADSLQKQPLVRNVLWLSLDDFDQSFSAQRALHRNYVIHTLAELTIAAQCTLGKGGTWDGICHNLKNGWNPICIFDDGREGTLELQNRGVQGITASDLQNLAMLSRQNFNFMQE